MAGGSSEHGRSVASKLACILAVFNADRVRMRASEVCRRTGLPFSTVHRLLAELVHHGLLEHAPDGTYTTGIKLWQIAAAHPDVIRLRRAALPAMCDLHVSLRACVRLHVPVEADGLCVEELCGVHDGQMRHRLGLRFPLDTTAGGHILLAYARPAPLATTAQALRRVARIQQAGVAVSRNGTHVGVAVPVFDAAATLVASLEVLAVLPADLARLVPPVRLAGNQVSKAAAQVPRPRLEVVSGGRSPSVRSPMPDAQRSYRRA